MLGETVAHYRIVERLGRGRMGEVYLAEDTRRSHPVALKLLSSDLIFDADARRRFVREATATMALDHPGICTVYEVGDAGGQLFIAMALLEGEALRTRLVRGPLPIEQSIDIAAQVASALAAAHGKGILHRNIKPENIMLIAEGRAKVLDFGLARLADISDATRTEMVLGTVAYMSPEQVRGDPVDERADVWSLGVVLYEMLTGVQPFRAAHESTLKHEITHQSPAPPTDLRPGIPSEVERVVMRCMEKQASSRFMRAADVLSDLEGVKRAVAPLESAPTELRPPRSPANVVAVQILGERYRIERLLGRGGMGEVWLAFDLKLGVEVALKFLLPELRADRVALLRREVRAARAVASPHACRVYDLVEIEGQDVVSMEYVDGATLQDVLATRSPLELAEARRIAIQMLTGLQEIHSAGLVHRDLKPSNVMITRSGRVVVMDFGLAKSVSESQPVSVAGTPAYMSPEQMRGEAIDARTDLYAAGLILAEMVAPEGVRDVAARRALWDGLRRVPPQPPACVWGEMIRRAVAPHQADRYASAAEMARALGDASQRVSVLDEASPYPGLTAFSGEQARFFFGREMDVEAMWRKLGRLPMLALIGPSGTGKSSFLRAGVTATRPDGWSIVITTPGTAPFTALGQSLLPEFAGHTDAMRDLFLLHDVNRSIPALHGWRKRSKQALVIVDQFEELFTLSPLETQARYAELLGRMSVEADIHVLISMRDDFFLQCHSYLPLRPLFTEPVPLGPLSHQDLRRAIVEPARLCGVVFEDDALVDEMMKEVEGERGGLPMVAFAVAKLWELRDRERGVITRRSYEEIGRVAGALAQHAEATLERIGNEREPVVREIFRNLITSKNTRLVRERDELLSLFGDHAAAEQVLNALIDARLLTSFEIEAGREGSVQRHRIEIVHESLLTNWPRLVRWQTQDAEGALMRDQLRQAAQLWKERSESDDLLWTGTAYKEFELWRERYPGGLTEAEESFARCMIARNASRRRRRRMALASSLVLMVALLGIFWGLWQRAQHMTHLSEARRLHMVAEDALENDNTLALALSTAILERDDDPAVRRTALRALWKAPTYFTWLFPDSVLNFYWGTSPQSPLSPDGKWLVTNGDGGPLLWPRDGSAPLELSMGDGGEHYRASDFDFSPDGRFLAARAASRTDGSMPDELVLWSLPEGHIVRTWKPAENGFVYVRGNPPRLLLADHDDQRLPYKWWRYELPQDDPVELGRADTHTQNIHEFTVDPSGRFLLDWKDKAVYLFPLDALNASRPILISHLENEPWGLAFDASGYQVVVADKMGRIRVWSRLESGDWQLELDRQTDETVIRYVGFDPPAGRVVYRVKQIGQVALLDIGQPKAEPTLFWPPVLNVPDVGFAEDASWIAFSRTGYGSAVDGFRFYPLTARLAQVFRVFPEEAKLHPLCFIEEGRRLVTTRIPALRLFDVTAGESPGQLLWQHPTGQTITSLAYDPNSRRFLGGSYVDGEGWLISTDGSPPRPLPYAETGSVGAVTFSPDGERVALADFWGGSTNPETGVIQVWNLRTGRTQVLRTGGPSGFYGLCFLPDDRLVSTSVGGLLLWDLASGSHEVLSSREHTFIAGLDASQRRLLVDTPRGLTVWDLEARVERVLPIPSDEWLGSEWTATNRRAISPDGTFVVSGMSNGEVWVMQLNEREPHLLLGHEGGVSAVWIPPTSDRIHTAASDGTVRVWNVPHGVPLHTLPLAKLLEVLRAQTNMRVVLDEKASDGYRVSYDEFRAWDAAPNWQNPAPR